MAEDGAMRVVLVANTKSGRGLAERTAERFAGALAAAGHDVVRLGTEEPNGRLQREIASAEAMLLAGGDGTVFHAADAAIAGAVPVYHIPCGNENLFAREFGMDRDPETLLRALRSPRVWQVDVGRAQRVDAGGVNGEGRFLLMCGVGPDARVIKRLAATRTRAIGHLAYLEPVLREAVWPRIPRVWVEVDGQRLVDGERGMLLVANSRQYALRIDPAHRASMTDGKLDVVFLPCRGTAGALLWMGRLRLRLGSWSSLNYRQGAVINVRSDEADPCQLDGDAPRWSESASPLSLRLTIEPGVLKVLVP
jgi:diacylglycerol kinase family enzyme